MAVRAAKDIKSQFCALFRVDDIVKAMPMIRHYIETTETAILLISGALAICKRNSPVGIAIYKDYM